MTEKYFRFRLRDPITGKWYRARWKATAEDIAERGGVIDGPAEVRLDLYGTDGGYFRPFLIVPHADLMRIEEPAPDVEPELDETERWLARLFLRRYVTWCARARHQDRIDAAVRLFRCLGTPPLNCLEAT